MLCFSVVDGVGGLPGQHHGTGREAFWTSPWRAAECRTSLRILKNEARLLPHLRTRPLVSTSLNGCMSEPTVTGRFQPDSVRQDPVIPRVECGGGCCAKPNAEPNEGYKRRLTLIWRGRRDQLRVWCLLIRGDCIAARRSRRSSDRVLYWMLTGLTACRQVLVVCLSKKDSVEVTKIFRL